MVLMKKTTTVNTLWKVIIACTGVLIVSLGIFAEQVYAQQANREVNNILMRGVRESNKPITTNKDTDEDRRENEENQASLWVIAPADLEAIARRLTAQCDQKCQFDKQRTENASPRDGLLTSYEAAWCACNCLYQGIPMNYAGRDGLRQCRDTFATKARAMGSNVPIYWE